MWVIVDRKTGLSYLKRKKHKNVFISMWLRHKVESTEHIFTPNRAYRKCSIHQNVDFNLKNAKYNTKNLSLPVNLHLRFISKSPILARYASMFIHDRRYPYPPPNSFQNTQAYTSAPFYPQKNRPALPTHNINEENSIR